MYRLFRVNSIDNKMGFTIIRFIYVTILCCVCSRSHCWCLYEVRASRNVIVRECRSSSFHEEKVKTITNVRCVELTCTVFTFPFILILNFIRIGNLKKNIFYSCSLI